MVRMDSEVIKFRDRVSKVVRKLMLLVYMKPILPRGEFQITINGTGTCDNAIKIDKADLFILFFLAQSQ